MRNRRAQPRRREFADAERRAYYSSKFSCESIILDMDEINDIHDLVRILREQPDWADVIRGILLSKDMLNLPLLFAELTEQVTENSRQIAELTRRFDGLAQQTGQLTRLVGELAQQTAELTRLVGELAQQTAENLRQTGELARLVSELAQAVQENQREFERYHLRMGLIEGRLGNLEGSDYERKVRYRVLSRARSRFGLENPYLALTQSDPEAPQLASSTARAVNNGVISREEADDLNDTDIIISSQDNRHVAAEVSLTADNGDIARAKARAGILRNATGGDVTPLVVTAVLNGPQHELAIAEGVATLILPYP